jgi:cytoskeleton protein RodZ
MDGHGIGLKLRTERERRRVSLDTISRATLVRRDYLELIDADRLAELPAGAYAKGFIRSYASFLGLDPRPYVNAYEHEVDQPAPELSAVVRNPVRVPTAAQPRAWRIAVGAAVGLLILLGLLGAFRSGSAPGDEPQESATIPAGELITPGPNPLGAVLHVLVVRDATWVEVEADGQHIFGETLQQGDERTFRADRELRLYITRSANVRLDVNGVEVGPPPGPSYRATITPATDELPPASENVEGSGEETRVGGDARHGQA